MVKRYSVHKIFGPTIQGEGGMSGAVSYFVRFSGCNMWDGRPETRSDSQCPFCDTDFFSHQMMTAEEILEALQALDHSDTFSYVTLTGGEPLLQVDKHLVDTLRGQFMIAVETNGTLPCPDGVEFDYLTLSPKVVRSQLAIKEADCLKLLCPHPNPLINPKSFMGFPANSYYLQPIAGDDDDITNVNVNLTVKTLYALGGAWRLSLQIHKILDVE